jgi:hypothetical protein
MPWVPELLNEGVSIQDVRDVESVLVSLSGSLLKGRDTVFDLETIDIVTDVSATASSLIDGEKALFASDDRSRESLVASADIFCERWNNQIGALLKRTLIGRAREGVIGDNKSVRAHFNHLLLHRGDINNPKERIRGCFEDDSYRIGLDESRELVEIIGVNQINFGPSASVELLKDSVCLSIALSSGDDVPTLRAFGWKYGVDERFDSGHAASEDERLFAAI